MAKQHTKIRTSTSSSDSIQTMDELLAREKVSLHSLRRGDMVKAKILSVGKREILADIGGKSYGIIIGREFEHIAPLKKNLKLGKTYDAEVIIPEMEGGETLISLKKTLIDTLWNSLLDIQKEKKEIIVYAERAISGGLLVEYKALKGFIPQMQLDPKYQSSPEKLVGTSFSVQVLEVDQKQNRLVMSQKEVTQKNELTKKRKAIHQYKEKDIVKAVIDSVDRYTVMVTIKGKVKSKKKYDPVEGLLHISEVSWERVENLEKQYKKGDTLEAQVIGFDDQEGRVLLSVKHLTPDPWKGIENKYSKDTQVSGTIVRIRPIGVFVELEKGIEGLIHISKIPAGKEFKEGDKISVTIDTLDTDKRKISLAYVPTTKPIGYR